MNTFCSYTLLSLEIDQGGPLKKYVHHKGGAQNPLVIWDYYKAFEEPIKSLYEPKPITNNSYEGRPSAAPPMVSTV